MPGNKRPLVVSRTASTPPASLKFKRNPACSPRTEKKQEGGVAPIRMELHTPLYQPDDRHCPAGMEGTPTTGMYAKVCGRYDDRKTLYEIFDKVKGQGGKVISKFNKETPKAEQHYKVTMVSPVLVSAACPRFKSRLTILFVCAQFMQMVDMCGELGLEFPIKWDLASATEAWNPRALAKLFADIVLVNNPTTGTQDWLLTADNHVGGSLYPVTSWVIEKFRVPVPAEQQEVTSSIWIAGGNFADTGMGGIVFSGLLYEEKEMKAVQTYLTELGYKAQLYPDPIN